MKSPFARTKEVKRFHKTAVDVNFGWLIEGLIVVISLLAAVILIFGC